jgi:Holliday junction resolvasome RuvABC endonuclease subunit
MERNIKILGFDPGTANMGYAVVNGILREPLQASEAKFGNSFGVLATSKWSDMKAGGAKTDRVEIPVRDRIDSLGRMIKGLVREVRPDYIAVEDFVEQGKRVGKTYKEMAFLIEHMRLLGRELEIDTRIYTNSYWKQRTLKTAHATKLQVQHYVAHKLPETAMVLCNQPDHVWDSTAIGLCLWHELIGC